MAKSANRAVAPVAVDFRDPLGSEAKILAAFLKAADRFDDKHGRSEAAARRQLMKEGVITKTGRLTKRFGG